MYPRTLIRWFNNIFTYGAEYLSHGPPLKGDKKTSQRREVIQQGLGRTTSLDIGQDIRTGLCGEDHDQYLVIVNTNILDLKLMFVQKIDRRQSLEDP